MKTKTKQKLTEIVGISTIVSIFLFLFALLQNSSLFLLFGITAIISGILWRFISKDEKGN